MVARPDRKPPFVPDSVDRTGFDPMPPPLGQPEPRRWWGHHLGELRWQLELARLLADPVYRGVGVPTGDGAPVLAIPGFLAGDPSLAVLRAWLDRIGYEPHASGIQWNVDCSDRSLDRLERRLAKIHERARRKVVLLGHSRGGHFAKALAHRHPDRVASVISLGAGLDTAFDISIPTKFTVAAVRAVHRRTTDRVARNGCFTDCCRCRYTLDFAGEFPEEVPLTSIYSRTDGVVWWETCVVDYARCVEVPGCHVGLAVNRAAYRVIADTLAAERGTARRPAAVPGR